MSEFDNKLSAENLIAHFAPDEEDLSVQDESNQESKTANPEIQDHEKNINWHKLAHKLREHNRKLLKKVFQLEQEVIETNQSLSEQEKSLQSNNVYSAKQAEKINRYEEEISEFSQKLVGYEREIHSQKATIENLTLQLETSQQKATQLDQEFLQLRNAVVEKDLALSDRKQTIKELKTRLERQQYQFVQSKAEVAQERTAATVRNEPIQAWSANYGEANVARQTMAESHNHREEQERATPAIAKNNNQPISSIAAVKLPQFSRQAE